MHRVWDAHGAAVLGYAVNALHDRGLAEDCVQETFLRAWRSRARFDPVRASERTWLFAIARNVVIDAARARARRPTVIEDEQWPETSGSSPDPADRLSVLAGLAQLSPPHREVLVAVHLEGRTYRELAEATGVPVATWRTRAYHALRAMRRHLQDEEEHDEHAR